MTREDLIDLVRAILGEHAVLGAIARTSQLEAVAHVLLAKPPARAAAIAPYNGTLHISHSAVEIENPWGREPVAVDRARLIVANGTEIVAGQCLTDGEVAITDTITVLGQRAAMEQIANALGPLLDISYETACEVATPMVSLVEVDDLDGKSIGVRMTPACFEAAIAAIAAVSDAPMIRGHMLAVGYDVLAAHRDPPHDMFAKQRAAEVERHARQIERIADLEQRAPADRVARQQLVLASMDPALALASPPLDATMLVCREAKPGAFQLERAYNGTWHLDCTTTHSHFRNRTPIATVIAERPAIDLFLALPPGSRVHFDDGLQVRTRGSTFPLPDSFLHRLMSPAREIVLDDDARAIAMQGTLAAAVAAIAERFLIPSARAKELVVAVRPKFQPSNDLDRELLAIYDQGGIIAAIKRYREAANAGLADAKSYVERLVAQRSP